MASVTRQYSVHITEEIHNGIPFKHILELENGVKKESYYINGKVSNVHDYEEALLNAAKEDNKKGRKKLQEERIKIYEGKYKGNVKIVQQELKQALATLEAEINKLADERLKNFFVFKPDTLSSLDHMSSIKDKEMAEAQKLAQAVPESSDIKKIQDRLAEIQALIPRVRETFISAVNNGINKANDTKLLKELLDLL